MAKERKSGGGCGAALAIVVAGTFLLGIGGALLFLSQARRHEAERVELELAREEALRAREAELRAEAQRAEREAEERAKREAELAAARRHEAELAERFAREAEERADSPGQARELGGLEAAPGVGVGVRVRVFRQGKLTGVEYEVLEVRGSRARVRQPGSEAEGRTWLDFAQIPRYDLLPGK